MLLNQNKIIPNCMNFKVYSYFILIFDLINVVLIFNIQLRSDNLGKRIVACTQTPFGISLSTHKLLCDFFEQRNITTRYVFTVFPVFSKSKI